MIFLVMYKRENEIDFEADEDKWAKCFETAGGLFLNPLVKLCWALPFMQPLVNWAARYHTLGKMSARVYQFVIETVDLRNSFIERQAKKHRSGEDGGGGKPAPMFKPRLIDGFIDALIDKKITLEQFTANAYFLLLAGFDTTAATITCLLWQMAQHPKIQSKARRLLIEEGIEADYIGWCVKETLRWFPPVPLGTGRVAGEDITTNDGLLIPKGSYVMPSSWSIHHDERNWPQHDKYIPERWLPPGRVHVVRLGAAQLPRRQAVHARDQARAAGRADQVPRRKVRRDARAVQLLEPRPDLHVARPAGQAALHTSRGRRGRVIIKSAPPISIG